MSLLAQIHALLSRISRYAVWAGGAALMLAAFMVTIDVLARKFLNVTMSGSDEITGYVFAAATTWAYSYCVLNRANVRIDALYLYLPRKLCAWLDLFGLTLLLIYMAYLTAKAVDVFATSWQRDSVAITTLATPLWMPQLAWLAGLVLFCITLTFLIAYTVTALWLGDTARVQQIAGASSVSDEIDRETHGIVEVNIPASRPTSKEQA